MRCFREHLEVHALSAAACSPGNACPHCKVHCSKRDCRLGELKSDCEGTLRLNMPDVRMSLDVAKVELSRSIQLQGARWFLYASFNSSPGYLTVFVRYYPEAFAECDVTLDIRMLARRLKSKCGNMVDYRMQPIKHKFTPNSDNQYHGQFIPIKKLFDPANGYIKDDTITIEADIFASQRK